MVGMGLSITDSVELTKAKIAGLGLDVLQEMEDPGGLFSTYMLYWATVVRRDADESDSLAPQQAIERSPQEALCRAAVRAFFDPIKSAKLDA